MHEDHIFLSYRSLERDFALKLARDLKLAGFRVWMDCMEGIQPGDDWRDAIQDAIDTCSAMIAALSPEYVKSEYCQKEIKRANSLKRPIFPVLLQQMAAKQMPLTLEGVQYVDFTNEAHYEKGFDALVKRLQEKVPDTGGIHLDAESRYLVNLIATLEKGRGVQEYIELHGRAEAVRPQPLTIDELGYYKLLNPTVESASTEADQPDVQIGSIHTAQQMHERFVLLGVPGSGKTTTLRRLARMQAQLRLENPRTAPIPVWMSLAAWQQEDEDPFNFVQTHWPLDGDLRQLLADGDVVLYMDGLNEMGEGSSVKISRLREWLHGETAPSHVFVSCRVEDYSDDLKLPQVAIEPLTEPQVHQFAEKYLEERSAGFLERIYAEDGDKSLSRLARNPYLLGALVYLYQEAEDGDLPRNSGDLSRRLVAALWDRERQRQTPGWVPFERMQETLARVAFDMIDRGLPTLIPKRDFLQQLTTRRLFGGQKRAQMLFNAVKHANLIENRGELVGFYHQLIQEYFAASRLLEVGLSKHVMPLEAVGVMGHRQAKKWDQVVIAACGCDAHSTDEVLSTVAALDPVLATACVQSGAQFSESALQDVRQGVAECIADQTNWRRRKLGVEAAILLDDLDLLVMGAHDFDFNVRFTALGALVGRTEETAIKSFVSSITFRDAGVQGIAARGLSEAGEAGLAALLECLKSEKVDVRRVAVGCLSRHMDDACVVEQLSNLLEIETDAKVREKIEEVLLESKLQAVIRGDIGFEELFIDFEPAKRAEFGHRLAALGDPRPGVGVIAREDGLKLPDIDWVPIPDDGAWTYQKDKHPGLPAFRIARYPVTYAQFQCFADAPDYDDDRWWKDMPWGSRMYELSEQALKYANLPRETVAWYQAVAFCRWLSDKLNYEVTLPTEQQWEKAARGTDGRQYPYEGKFDAAKGNTRETAIGQTSAVGIFLSGASPYGVLDMSGNVWEWCLNEYNTPNDVGGGHGWHPPGSAWRCVELRWFQRVRRLSPPRQSSLPCQRFRVSGLCPPFF